MTCFNPRPFAVREPCILKTSSMEKKTSHKKLTGTLESDLPPGLASPQLDSRQWTQLMGHAGQHRYRHEDNRYETGKGKSGTQHRVQSTGSESLSYVHKVGTWEAEA